MRNLIIVVLLLTILVVGAHGWLRDSKYGTLANEIEGIQPVIGGGQAGRAESINSVNAVHLQNITKINDDFRNHPTTDETYRDLIKKENDRFYTNLCYAQGGSSCQSNTASTTTQSPAPGQQSARPETFHELETDNPSVRKFQLDGRVAKQVLVIDRGPNDEAESWADGKLCTPAYPACNDPNGTGGRPMDVAEELRLKWNVADFPVSGARFNSLVLYQGNEGIQIGEHKLWPAGSGSAVVGPNSRLSENDRNTGGYIITIKITKKGGK